MTTGAPADKPDRDHEKNETPQLRKEVITLAKLPGLDEMTVTVEVPQHESWWRGFSQHTLAHIVSVILLAGLALGYARVSQSFATKAAVATDCRSTDQDAR